jgi:hypothetical protein
MFIESGLIIKARNFAGLDFPVCQAIRLIQRSSNLLKLWKPDPIGKFLFFRVTFFGKRSL